MVSSSETMVRPSQQCIVCILQYFLGSSGWVDIPGGGDARDTAVCTFTPRTGKNLWLRAVNSADVGETAIKAKIYTKAAGES